MVVCRVASDRDAAHWRCSMLSYKEYDNAKAVEIVLAGRVSTTEFDKIALKLEAFIKRHGHVRLLECVVIRLVR